MEEGIVKIWWLINPEKKTCKAVFHKEALKYIKIHLSMDKTTKIRVFAGNNMELPKKYKNAVKFIKQWGDEVGGIGG